MYVFHFIRTNAPLTNKRFYETERVVTTTHHRGARTGRCAVVDILHFRNVFPHSSLVVGWDTLRPQPSSGSFLHRSGGPWCWYRCRAVTGKSNHDRHSTVIYQARAPLQGSLTVTHCQSKLSEAG